MSSSKIAIISDVHGNLEALESILADAGEVDGIWCLGDIVGYGANPIECLKILMGLDNLVCVKGNHDATAYGWEIKMNNQARAAIIWTRQQLNDNYLNWMHGLPLVEYPCDNTVMVHSTLGSPHLFEYFLMQYDMQQHFAHQVEDGSDICFVGHSHVPCGIIYNKDNGDMLSVPEFHDGLEVSTLSGHTYTFNPGGAGQPRGIDDWRAPYIMATMEDNKVVSVQMKRVEYDVFKARTKIIDAGLPEEIGNRLLKNWTGTN